MNDASSPPRDIAARNTQRAGDDPALLAWLHRSLSRQYDAVLDEDLPPAIAAVVGRRPGDH